MKCAVYHSTTREVRLSTNVDMVNIDDDVNSITEKVLQALRMNGYEYVARISVLPNVSSIDAVNARRAEMIYRLSQHGNPLAGDGNWCLGDHVVYCKNFRETRSSMVGDIFIIDSDVYIVTRPFGYVKIGGEDLAQKIMLTGQ